MYIGFSSKSTQRYNFTKNLLRFCKKIVTVKFKDFNTVSTVWKNEKFSFTKNISSNQLFSAVTYSVKTLLSRNFCQNCVRENFRSFSTLTHDFSVKSNSRKIAYITRFHEFFRENNFKRVTRLTKKSCTLTQFHEFLHENN